MDNIWTNMTVTSCELTDNIKAISDHSVIKVRLRIDIAEKRGIPHKTETVITS